jgi:hypothetical protein
MQHEQYQTDNQHNVDESAGYVECEKSEQPKNNQHLRQLYVVEREPQRSRFPKLRYYLFAGGRTLHCQLAVTPVTFCLKTLGQARGFGCYRLFIESPCG